MNEKELGQALLNLEMTPTATDPRQLTRRILENDRRRVRWMTLLTLFFWVLTTVGVICLRPLYVMIIAPRLRAYQLGHAQLDKDWNDWVLLGDWTASWLLACIVSLLLAAICTVLLILFSRRATLRQINANLVQISEQLKQLRSSTPVEPGRPNESSSPR